MCCALRVVPVNESQYGTSRSATTSFHAHHLRLISLATHRENMAILLTAADRLNLSATSHVPLPTAVPSKILFP